MLLTDPAVTCASAGAISPPARPLAKFSAPIRNSSVMKLNASVNGGTFQAPMNTLASAACRIVEKTAPSDDPDHHQRVPVGLQEQRQAGADQHAVEAEQAGADRAAVHADQERRGGRRRRGRARRRSRATPRPTNIATRIASPVTGLFMKQTCPTPRRQESTKSSSGFACARSAHAGIVPLIDRPGGDAASSRCSSVCSLLRAPRPYVTMDGRRLALPFNDRAEARSRRAQQRCRRGFQHSASPESGLSCLPRRVFPRRQCGEL